MNTLNLNRKTARRLRKILQEESLLDFNQFTESLGAIELPLFSRVSQVEFMDGLSNEDIDVAIIIWSLKYLNQVIRSISASKFLAAITFLECDMERVLVPHIFVLVGSAQDFIESIKLEDTNTEMSKRIRSALKAIGVVDQYDVLQDFVTIEEDGRLFIGQKHPRKASVIPIRVLKQTGPNRR